MNSFSNGRSIDWKNYEILQVETDYHKRKFIESFYINSLSNVLNDKKSVCFPSRGSRGK